MGGVGGVHPGVHGGLGSAQAAMQAARGGAGTFRFPGPGGAGVGPGYAGAAGAGGDGGGSDNEDNSSEPSPISKVDRSNSAPNVSGTIIAGDGPPLPEYIIRSQKKDIRTQGMTQLDELFNVRDLPFLFSSNTNVSRS